MEDVGLSEDENLGSRETFGDDRRRRKAMQRHARTLAEGRPLRANANASRFLKPPAGMTPAQGLGLLAVMAIVLVSTVAGGRLLDLLGVRGYALLMLIPALAAAAGMRRAPRSVSLSPLERGALLAVLLLALATGAPSALMLLPALVQAAVARLMLTSLGDKESLIERTAKIWQPLAPDFIGPYCRKLTVLWSVLFGASAVVIAVLALTGRHDAWKAWCGWGFWSLLGVFVVAEFLWRKSWFRYYGPGPFDRFLARIFPSGNTELGRRSQAYMDHMHEELARMAEADRAGRSGV